MSEAGGSSGGGSSGSSSGGKPSGSGSSSSSGGTAKSVPLSGKPPAGKGSATAYGGGGGKSTTIPYGVPFAGRTAGGATRGQVYGSRWVLASSARLESGSADMFYFEGRMGVDTLGVMAVEFLIVDFRSFSGR